MTGAASSIDESAISDGLHAVRAVIDAACARAARSPSEVTLVGVTKKHPTAVVVAAHRLGLLDVGENYVQEMVAKQAELGVLSEQLRWHYIGRLQRNKVKDVLGRCVLLHAVDSVALLEELDKRAAARGLRQQVLIAVSVAGETQKSGVVPGQLGEVLSAAASLSHVLVRGLMTMPPFAEEPEDSRRYFRALRELRDQHGGVAALPFLSMGTTGDYAVAIEEGATHVRVGTAIFGERAK